MGKEGKTPKKDKKDKTPSKSKGGDDEEEGGELRPVCAIAKPLADVGFHKKILKVVKKGAPRGLPRGHVCILYTWVSFCRLSDTRKPSGRRDPALACRRPGVDAD